MKKVLVLVSLALSAAVLAQPRYNMTRFPAPAGQDYAFAVNSLGHVTGYTNAYGAARAYIYNRLNWTALTPLDDFSRHCEGLAINGSGDVVGWSNNNLQRKRPVLWSNGVVQSLGIFPGFDLGAA